MRLSECSNYVTLCDILLSAIHAKDMSGQDHAGQYDYMVSDYRLHYSLDKNGVLDSIYWVGKHTIPIMKYQRWQQRWKLYAPISSTMALRTLLHLWVFDAAESMGADIHELLVFFRQSGLQIVSHENTLWYWQSIKESYLLTRKWTCDVIKELPTYHETELLF